MTFRIGAVALLACGIAAAQVTEQQLFSVTTIGGVHLSPDGKTLLFTVSNSDPTEQESHSRLLQLTLGHSGDPKPVVTEGTPGNLVWSPDSKEFAYIAKGAIWVQKATGGKPHRVCDYDRSNAYLSKAGSNLAWSPDGTRLAFAGTIEPKPDAGDPIVIDRILYKTRTSISDNRPSHIYVVPAKGGKPKAVTAGNFDEHSIDWSHGNDIVYLSNHERDPDAVFNYDIFTVDAETAKSRQITKTPGVEFTPKMSPDGKYIAYGATTRKITTIDSVAEDYHLWVVPTAGGAARELNKAQDRRTTVPDWSGDSSTIYYIVSDQGKMALYQIPVQGGTPKPVVDRKGHVTAFTVARTGNEVVYAYNDPANPGEVFSSAGPLTHLNKATANWKLTAPETLHYRSFDGTEVEGWFYPALGVTGPAPLILNIHGGPHSIHGYSFNAAFQSYASHGYATLAINPRGTNGYGQKFSDGCVNDWGGGDYKDLMAGVDYLLQTHPSQVDGSKMGVTGGSYGGFMTNWVITQTDRFKAAVSSASLSNLISFYATSLYQDLIHAEFNGFPWENGNFATLWKWSPLAHITKAKTPTMFLHGENDNDVHITQSEEMYTALRYRGVPAELVRYPREGHGFHEPKHQADARRRTLEWMDRWIRRP